MNQTTSRNWAMAALVLAAATSAQAQIISVEPINVTLTPNQPVFHEWYPNVFDPTHPKRLYFEGTVSQVSTLPGDGVRMWFDWMDPILGPQMSPEFLLGPGGVFQEYWIDFCPQQVSIHFQIENPSMGDYNVEGAFVHECVVPEPSTYAAFAALGLVGFAAFRRLSEAPSA